jgi:hypothetical protein
MVVDGSLLGCGTCKAGLLLGGQNIGAWRCRLLRRMSPLVADIVAKVFLGWRTKILRAADAFSARRREGPYRFIQNRSWTSVVALKSDAAAEKSKDQLWRDFRGFSIFDFCNNIRPAADIASELALTHLGTSLSDLLRTIVEIALVRSCRESKLH